MLSLNQTFDDTRTIKVLVVPVGNNSLFDNHFQVVSRLRDIPFYELNRPYGNASAPFKHLNWNTGNLLFDYSRYDRVPNGPGDLDNFQSSRRILMVMGLINYPELGDVADKIEEELDFYSRRHPYVILRRLFVFNFSFDEVNGVLCTPPKGLSDEPNSLVIFPPEGFCEGGKSMVDVHLKEIMSHAAVKIIVSLEKQMEQCEDSRTKNIVPANLPLTTIHDDIEDPTPSQIKDSMATRNIKKLFRKKSSGRLRKWMGDLSLQVCSPVNAIENYNVAISDCRALGDAIWLAGALDGYAAAVLLLMQHELDLEEIIGKDLRNVPTTHPITGEHLSDTERGLKLAEDRANEAIAVYSRNIVFCSLQVESTLRLARMHETSPASLLDREQKVMYYVLKSLEVEGLNTQQQIECILEGALICHRLGLKRKYALYLYVAATMCAENDNYAVAHTLIHYACYQYGIATGTLNMSPLQMTTGITDGYSSEGHLKSIKIIMEGTSSLQKDATDSKMQLDMNSIQDRTPSERKEMQDVLVVDPQASWPSIRAALFMNGVLVANEQGDTKSSCRFLSSLLRLMRELEHEHASNRKNWENVQHSKYLGGKYEKLLNWTSLTATALTSANIPVAQAQVASIPTSFATFISSHSVSTPSTASDRISAQLPPNGSAKSSASISQIVPHPSHPNTVVQGPNLQSMNSRSLDFQQSFNESTVSELASETSAPLVGIAMSLNEATTPRVLYRSRSVVSPSDLSKLRSLSNLTTTPILPKNKPHELQSSLSSTGQIGKGMVRSNSNSSLASLTIGNPVQAIARETNAIHLNAPLHDDIVSQQGVEKFRDNHSESVGIMASSPRSASKDIVMIDAAKGVSSMNDSISQMGSPYLNTIPTFPRQLKSILNHNDQQNVEFARDNNNYKQGIVVGVSSADTGRNYKRSSVSGLHIRENLLSVGKNFRTVFDSKYSTENDGDAVPTVTKTTAHLSLNNNNHLQTYAIKNPKAENDMERIYSTLNQVSRLSNFKGKDQFTAGSNKSGFLNSMTSTASVSFSERLMRSMSELNLEEILLPDKQTSGGMSSSQIAHVPFTSGNNLVPSIPSTTGASSHNLTNAPNSPFSVSMDLFQAVDIIKSLSQLLMQQRVSLEQQSEAISLFAFLSQKLPPFTTVHLPINLISMQPIGLQNIHKPHIVDCVPSKAVDSSIPAVLKAKQSVNQIKKYVEAMGSQSLTAADSVSGEESLHSPKAIPKQSALFYDPFAAKREKSLIKNTTDVLWSVNVVCKFYCIFSNPLSIPLYFENVVPVLEGVPYRLFRQSLLIPANCDNHTVELRVKPLKTGWLKVIGIQLFLQNAINLIKVDEFGHAVKLRSEVNEVEEYPRKVNSNSSKSNPKKEKENCSAVEAFPTNEIHVIPYSPVVNIRTSWRDVNSSGNGSMKDGTEKVKPSQPLSVPLELSQLCDYNLNLEVFSGESRLEAVYIDLFDNKRTSTFTETETLSKIPNQSSSQHQVDDIKITLKQYNYPVLSQEKKHLNPIATLEIPFRGPLSPVLPTQVPTADQASSTDNLKTSLQKGILCSLRDIIHPNVLSSDQNKQSFPNPHAMSILFDFFHKDLGALGLQMAEWLQKCQMSNEEDDQEGNTIEQPNCISDIKFSPLIVNNFLSSIVIEIEVVSYGDEDKKILLMIDQLKQLGEFNPENEHTLSGYEKILNQWSFDELESMDFNIYSRKLSIQINLQDRNLCIDKNPMPLKWAVQLQSARILEAPMDIDQSSLRAINKQLNVIQSQIDEKMNPAKTSLSKWKASESAFQTIRYQPDELVRTDEDPSDEYNEKISSTVCFKTIKNNFQVLYKIENHTNMDMYISNSPRTLSKTDNFESLLTQTGERKVYFYDKLMKYDRKMQINRGMMDGLIIFTKISAKNSILLAIQYNVDQIKLPTHTPLKVMLLYWACVDPLQCIDHNLEKFSMNINHRMGYITMNDLYFDYLNHHMALTTESVGQPLLKANPIPNRSTSAKGSNLVKYGLIPVGNISLDSIHTKVNLCGLLRLLVQDFFRNHPFVRLFTKIIVTNEETSREALTAATLVNQKHLNVYSVSRRKFVEVHINVEIDLVFDPRHDCVDIILIVLNDDEVRDISPGFNTITSTVWFEQSSKVSRRGFIINGRIHQRFPILDGVKGKSHSFSHSLQICFLNAEAYTIYPLVSTDRMTSEMKINCNYHGKSWWLNEDTCSRIIVR